MPNHSYYKSAKNSDIDVVRRFATKLESSYYQGAALENQSVPPAYNSTLDLVCVTCGADQGKCYHVNEDDYCLETRIDYESCTTFYRRFLCAAVTLLVVCLILLVALAGK